MFVSSTREKSHCLLIFIIIIIFYNFIIIFCYRFDFENKISVLSKGDAWFLSEITMLLGTSSWNSSKSGEQTSSAARPWIFNSIVHRPLFKLARFALWCKFDASRRRPDVLQLCYSPPSCFQFSLLPFANNPGYELARELIIRREMSKVASNVLINKILFDDRSITEFKPSF